MGNPSNVEKMMNDEELPAYSEDGVDLTLIRWMLSLTPLERLAVLQSTVDSILRIRDGRFTT